MLECLFIMYLSHFLGDYTLQTGVIAAKKSTSYYYTFLHCVIYTVVHFIGAMFIGCSTISFLLATLISLSHGIVDFIKAYITINKESLKEKSYYKLLDSRIVYVVDQVAHYIFTFMFCSLLQPYIVYQFELVENLDPRIYWLALYLVVMGQPTYVTYRLLFNQDHPITNANSTKELPLKIWMVIIPLAYVLGEPLLLLAFGIFFITPKKLKRDVSFETLAVLLILGIAVKIALDCLILI